MPTVSFFGCLLLAAAAGANQLAAAPPDAMWSSDSNSWRRVSNAADAPAGKVTPGEGRLFRESMDKHTAYLLADANLDDMVLRFREFAGAKKPPGKLRGWESTFPAHAAQFLMGAGNTLRWSENAQLRQRMDQVIDALKECRTPDGLLAAPAGAGGSAQKQVSPFAPRKNFSFAERKATMAFRYGWLSGTAVGFGGFA